MWFFRALTRTIGRAGTLDRPRKRRKSGTVSDLTRACIIEHCGAAVSVSLRKRFGKCTCAQSQSQSLSVRPSTSASRVRPSVGDRAKSQIASHSACKLPLSLSLSSYFLLSSLRTHLLGVSPITAAAGLTSVKKFPS